MGIPYGPLQKRDFEARRKNLGKKINSVQNMGSLPPYSIRGRNDNPNNNKTLWSLRGAMATWQSRVKMRMLSINLIPIWTRLKGD
jgi:hypothetical protein